MAFIEKFYNINKEQVDEINRQVQSFFNNEKNVKKLNVLRQKCSMIDICAKFRKAFSQNLRDYYRFVILSTTEMIVYQNFHPNNIQSDDLLLKYLKFDINDKEAILKEIQYVKRIQKLDIEEHKNPKKKRTIAVNFHYSLNNDESVTIAIYHGNDFNWDFTFVIDAKNHTVSGYPHVFTKNMFLDYCSETEKQYITQQIEKFYRTLKLNDPLIINSLLDFIFIKEDFVFNEELVNHYKLLHDVDVCSVTEVVLFKSDIFKINTQQPLKG